MKYSKFLAIVLMLGLAQAALGAIAFDAASSGYNGNAGTTLSWSHTIGSGTNRILVVGVLAEDGRQTDTNISSVKYNNVNMTLVTGSDRWQSPERVHLYYMLNSSLPAAGTYTVLVTYAALVDDRAGGAISLTGVAQQGAEVVATNSTTASATTISTNITTLANGAWVVDLVGSGVKTSFLTQTTGMVERFDQQGSQAHTAAGSTKPVATAGLTTMSWKAANSGLLIHSLAAFTPSGLSLPGKATNPSPANGATGVNINADLSWTAGSGATSHDVYFGTNPSPGAAEFKGNQAGTTYDPGTLANAKTYYWRINEKNADGATLGDVWSFTTQSIPPPVAEFVGSPTSGEVPLTVQFTDQSTNSPTAWSWTFGDAGTSTAQNPSHVYNAVGSYTVSLTASNASGSNTITKTNYITVVRPPIPTPNFSGSPTSGLAPLTVQFVNQSTGNISTYKWDLNGDGSIDWADSSGTGPSYIYTDGGAFDVTLYVQDDYDGKWYSTTKADYIIVTAPTLPTAAFAASKTVGSAPMTVTFWDQSTGTALQTWSWTFGDGGTSTAQSPTYVYNTQGTYDVSLTVTSPYGTDSEVKTAYIVVNPPAPCDANFAADPRAGFAPMEVAFSDTSTGSVTSWSWTFGDGGTSTQANPTHTYSEGTYTVSLTVTGPLNSDSITKTNYIIVDVAPAGGSGLTMVDSPSDLTNTHPHLWLRGYGPDNGMWEKAQTTHAAIWQRLSDTARTGSFDLQNPPSRSNAQELMRSAMAFVISKNAGFGNHAQDGVKKITGISWVNDIEHVETMAAMCLAFDALVDDPQTQWLTSNEKAAALQTIAAGVAMLNYAPGGTWRVRPTCNQMVLRTGAHAAGLYCLRGKAGYETAFETARQLSIVYHNEVINGLCEAGQEGTLAPLLYNGPRPLDSFPYEGPNYGAYNASRALMHRHILEYNEYPNPATILDENKSDFRQNYNLAWMAIMYPGCDQWVDVCYNGTHGIMQGVRWHSAVNKAVGNGRMASVGEWFYGQIINTNIGDNPDHGWWQGWEMVWYDPSITPMTPEAAGIPLYAHLDDAEFHNYRTSWLGQGATGDDTHIWFRNSAHESHNYWGEGHAGEGIPYNCTTQTSSHDGADNGHFGIYRSTTFIARNYSPQGNTNMHNCLLIDGLGNMMDDMRGYEVPALATTDCVGTVDSDYGHALEALMGGIYMPITSGVNGYVRHFFVIRDPMYAIVIDELEAGHTANFLCYAESANKIGTGTYRSSLAYYDVVYPASGYTASDYANPISITTTNNRLMFLVHATNANPTITKTYPGSLAKMVMGSDTVIYNPTGGSYSEGGISGNAKLFAQRSGGALIYKTTNASGSQYGISCSSPVNMSVKGRNATIYVYGGGSPAVTITSPYGTDVISIPAGQTIKKLLIGMTADPPVADFYAVPKTGWSIYCAPEFVSLSTGWITDYLWEFGDGSWSTEVAPNHKYGIAGIYDVKLTVSGPGGVSQKVKNDYITINDFANYDYPDYVLTEATMAAYDAAVDAIQASQTDYNPDPTGWCSDTAPNYWCSQMKYGGGGRILFGFSNTTIYINHDRDFFGDNLIIDGEDKGVSFYYNGPDDCSQTEGQDWLIRIHGHDNIFRNVNVDRFPDGFHLRGGYRNLAENVNTDVVCEDATTLNGGGNRCVDCILRNATYGGSTDKTVMIGGGGSISSNVINNITSTGGNQPIRCSGGGMFVVRNSTFRGHSNGPRYGGENTTVIFEKNLSTIYGTDNINHGLRLSENTNAWIRYNTMENCVNYGIAVLNGDCQVRAEYNTITGCTDGGVISVDEAVMDLGGGSVDIFRDAEPWLPAAQYPTTEPTASAGRNTFRGSGATGIDVINNAYLVTPGDILMTAEDNFWDNTTVGGVLANDVSGNVDVDPLGVSID